MSGSWGKFREKRDRKVPRGSPVPDRWRQRAHCQTCCRSDAPVRVSYLESGNWCTKSGFLRKVRPVVNYNVVRCARHSVLLCRVRTLGRPSTDSALALRSVDKLAPRLLVDENLQNVRAARIASCKPTSKQVDSQASQKSSVVVHSLDNASRKKRKIKKVRFSSKHFSFCATITIGRNKKGSCQ